jgi:hypothetical protein
MSSKLLSLPPTVLSKNKDQDKHHMNKNLDDHYEKDEQQFALSEFLSIFLDLSK